MRLPIFLFAALLASPACAADGGQLFADQCASCHVTAGASSEAGPSLAGVIWRRLAARDDFAYSPALKSRGGAWSPARLEDYLKDTQAFAPGTSMYFVVTDAEERKAIVGYLRSGR